MYEIINTYPKKGETDTADVRISAARVIYKELLRLWEERSENGGCNT